ncbi:hypothetical protein [Tolumonas lignilytica]|jgi:hypothetical protein|nr:hypothetical protein [Tolumonas lignilytica]
MRFVILLCLSCLLVSGCTKREGYRYLGDTEPNQSASLNQQE